MATARDTRATKAAEAADERKKEKTSTFKVRVGHTLTHDDVIYLAGDEVDLTEAQAKNAAGAIETETRKRSGQNSRLQRKIKELEQEVASLKGKGKTRRTKAEDEEHEVAVESIRQRGDSHELRGEPHFGQVPPEVEDAYHRAEDAEYVGRNAGLASDDDETGLKGMGRETAAGAGNRGPINPNAPKAQPSQGGEGALDEDRGQKPIE